MTSPIAPGNTRAVTRLVVGADVPAPTGGAQRLIPPARLRRMLAADTVRVAQESLVIGLATVLVVDDEGKIRDTVRVSSSMSGTRC